MFEALSAKLFPTLVSLSMLFFSSFQGNDPRLQNFVLSKSESFIYAKAELISAFENDFASIFSSGATIPIHLHFQLKKGNQILAKRIFISNVSFDPLTGIYQVSKEGMPPLKTQSLDAVKRELSHLECAIPYQESWGKVNAHLMAELPRVHFSTLDKELDLMVLWKYKKPSAKAQIDLRRKF